MEIKIYKCVCGKGFASPQSFNAHKSRCKVHVFNKYGNLDKLEDEEAKRSKSFKDTYRAKKKNLEENALKAKEEFIENWISEQHRCESCGKI